MAETKTQAAEKTVGPKPKAPAASEVSEKMRKFAAYIDQETYEHSWYKSEYNAPVSAYVSGILFGKMTLKVSGITADACSFKLDTPANHVLLLLIRIIYVSAAERKIAFETDLLAMADALQGDGQDVPVWHIIAAIIRDRCETWESAKYVEISEAIAGISKHYKQGNSEEVGIATAEAVVELMIDSICNLVIILRRAEITRKGSKLITITCDEMIGMLSAFDRHSARPISDEYLDDLCWCAVQFPSTKKLWANLNKKAIAIAKAKAGPKPPVPKKHA